jgi:2-polyprenyl-3-methyl-5-hydroxy-6-metoxy-1,4-benzoquinol methylase
MLSKPHFVRDYRRMVGRLSRMHDRDTAMSIAVGGDYEFMGSHQASIFRSLGLTDSAFVVDVGCGSGRLANALKGVQATRYHGTDVVPELLAYARERCGRSDWRFSIVERIEIPEESGVADFVVMASVLTHLSHKESFAYVQEAARVLKSGGTLFATFLDPAIASHRETAGSWYQQMKTRLQATGVKNALIPREQMVAWAGAAGLSCEIQPPDGGQSLAVMKKPPPAKQG